MRPAGCNPRPTRRTSVPNYTYFADDNIAQISYTDTNGQPLNPPTPSVSYAYDPNYNRQTTMVDGNGATVYAYNPVTVPPVVGANRLASIDGALPNDTITFIYDELGRVTNRKINGTANSETWAFDSLGRLSTDVNKLGTFNYSYIGVTDRLQTLAYPGGTTANYTYFPNLQDKRLQEIKNQTSASVLLSQFDYTYDTEGQLLTWTKNYPGLPAPQRYDLGYDNADQLLTAPLKKTTNNALIRQYAYGYDPASNRTSERVGNATTNSIPNNVNEITSQSGATNRTLSYDANGSLTSDGGTRTFEWDGANRLVAVNYAGTNQRSEFSYDGLSRCVKIVEKTGNTVNSTRKFVSCGTDKCEYRNSNGAVQLQIFAQGQYQSNAPYFYMRDHLGSIREMTDVNGTVVARHDYDPWGRFNTVIGTNKPDFNFTGLYQHTKSGLDMATYRFYDPDLGRWLSRDPIGEHGGVNLYRYVGNNSVNGVDPDGLDWVPAPGGGYNFVVRDLNLKNLAGSSITNSNANYSCQCAAGAQFLTGTVVNGVVHDAPSTRKADGSPNWRPGEPWGRTRDSERWWPRGGRMEAIRARRLVLMRRVGRWRASR